MSFAPPPSTIDPVFNAANFSGTDDTTTDARLSQIDDQIGALQASDASFATSLNGKANLTGATFSGAVQLNGGFSSTAGGSLSGDLICNRHMATASSSIPYVYYGTTSRGGMTSHCHGQFELDLLVTNTNSTGSERAMSVTKLTSGSTHTELMRVNNDGSTAVTGTVLAPNFDAATSVTTPELSHATQTAIRIGGSSRVIANSSGVQMLGQRILNTVTIASLPATQTLGQVVETVILAPGGAGTFTLYNSADGAVSVGSTMTLKNQSAYAITITGQFASQLMEPDGTTVSTYTRNLLAGETTQVVKVAGSKWLRCDNSATFSSLQSQITSNTNDIASKQNIISTSVRLPANCVGAGTVDDTKLGYLSTTTSDVQTQINGKRRNPTYMFVSSANSAANVTSGIAWFPNANSSTDSADRYNDTTLPDVLCVHSLDAGATSGELRLRMPNQNECNSGRSVRVIVMGRVKVSFVSGEAVALQNGESGGPFFSVMGPCQVDVVLSQSNVGVLGNKRWCLLPPVTAFIPTAFSSIPSSSFTIAGSLAASASDDGPWFGYGV